MADYKIKDTTLTNIANAIRTKIGGTSAIRVDKMASAIESLSSDNHVINFRTDFGIIELSVISDLTINGSPATQVLLNNIVIWGDGSEPYSNLIKTATTDPGGTEKFNLIGYKDNARWSSSSAAIKVEGPGARVSGWMPATNNAVCRIKGFDVLNSRGSNNYVNNFYYVGYAADGTITTHTFQQGSTSAPFEYDATNDIATFLTPNKNYVYFRISGYLGSSNPVITINEEIT